MKDAEMYVHNSVHDSVYRSCSSPATGRRLGIVKSSCLVLGGFAISACLALGVLPRVSAAPQTEAAKKPDLVASWQGTLNVGRDMRLVLKITQSPNGGLQSTIFSVDPAGPGIPAKTTTFQDSRLSVDVEAFGAKYDGKVSADGNSISGNWQQGGQSLPLNFARATAETEWHLAEPPKSLPAMAANLHPSFEVATIKPASPDDLSKMFRIDGRRFSAIGMSVVDLISFSYGLQAQQVIDGPPWSTTDKFDVTGEPDAEGQPSEPQLKEMVQKLLADRFQLKFHNSEKQLGAYVLEVSKDGPKMKKSAVAPDGSSNMFFTKMGSMVVNDATMKDFTGLMQSAVFDRPVIDNTGIQGRWSFALNWTPDQSQFASFGAKVPPPSDAADAPPPIFTALQEQAGLKLEARKTAAVVMVMDHVAKPSAN